MRPKVCRCCGGTISPDAGGGNVNVCNDCERWLEDDSPREAVLDEETPPNSLQNAEVAVVSEKPKPVQELAAESKPDC